MAIMFGCENLRAFGVNFSVANPDSIDPVHQLRDQIKIETGVAEGRDFLLGRDNYVRIFNCVIEVVPGHGRSNLMRVRSISKEALRSFREPKEMTKSE